MDKQERRYTLEVTEGQLRLIANCIEDCHRFASGQMELDNTLMHAVRSEDKRALRDGLRKLQPFLTPDLPMGSSYSWSGACCPNEEQKSFIARTYCLYREIYHKLRTLVPHDGDSVYDSTTLTCEGSGPLPRIRLKQEGEGMRGQHDIIYIATHDTDFSTADNNDFNIVLTEKPQVIMYKTYVSQHLVLGMLEKLRTVCGNTAINYVDKQIKRIKGEK